MAMRDRMTKRAIALGLLILAFPAVPAVAQEPGLTPEERTAIGTAWLNELRAYYASGDRADLPAMTEQGLEQLRAFDWRFRAVEAGTNHFEEEWGIIESEQWDELIEGDAHAWFELRLGYDVARLARTIDVATGDTVELTDGAQRRALNATFVPGQTPDTWQVDAIGVPKGTMEFGLRKTAVVVPCPRLGDAARARGPFARQPWCTAGGDGQRLKVGPFPRSDSKAAPDLYFERNVCGWEDTTTVWLGWPPGSPMDGASGTSNRYLRDPRGEVSRSGYRRSVRPPRDAISTGITNGYATIWTSKSLGEDAILVQVGNRFERWPQTGAGCMGN
jgi:hypothetical protein